MSAIRQKLLKMPEKITDIKIRIIHTTLFLGMGGLESIIMDIAKYLDKNQFKLYVLCLSRYDEKYKNKLQKSDIEVYCIKRRHKFDFSFFSKIVKLLNEKKIDLIHAHSGCFFNSAVCAWLARVPSFIYTEHGLQLLNDGTQINKSIQSRIEENISALISDYMFAVSEEIKTDMEKRFRFSKSKIKLVTNGIDTTLFKPGEKIPALKLINQEIPHDKFIIGSVGRLIPIKNYNCLLNAFAKLPAEILEKSHLVLIGDGTERSNLLYEARQLNISEKVLFLGVKYNISDLLPAFDLFVLPSFTEGTSISLLEAQSTGIPAVVTNVGGNPGIIEDGFNGFLCESDDSGDMSKKISQILWNSKLKEKMGINARKRVINKFSINNMLRTYTQTYQSLYTKKKI